MLDPDAMPPERVRPLSRREFDTLVELGMFQDERVELLGGVLVAMNAQGGPHSGISAWFVRRLIRALDDSYDVRAHSPFAAGKYSQPEPDVLVARRTRSLVDHPNKALLVIEVADSSSHRDRELKRAIYAKAGVPEYWIVDLKMRTVEVCTGPKRGRFEHSERNDETRVLRPERLRGVTIAVAAIPWPPRGWHRRTQRGRRRRG